LARNFSSSAHDAHSKGHEAHGHDAHSKDAHGQEAHGHEEHEHHESYYYPTRQDFTREWIRERVENNELPPPQLEDTQEFSIMKPIRRRFWEMNQRSIFLREKEVDVAPPGIGQTPFDFETLKSFKKTTTREGGAAHHSMVLSSTATGALFLGSFLTGNVLFDVCLSLAIPYHAHVGVLAITNDYVYGAIRGGFQLFSYLVFGISAVMLLDLSLNGTGIVGGISQMWTTQPQPDSPK